MNRHLIIVAGPTGVGKTGVAIELAKRLQTEIISCDSRQFYKELAIGTAVPSASQLADVKHHFIHHLTVTDYYNASQFEADTIALLDCLFINNPFVIMTGGTGLYIDAVCYGIDELPTISMEIRELYTKKLLENGIDTLRDELKCVDPLYYARVDLQNPKRIQKALEVFAQTGQPYSAMLTSEKRQRNFHVHFIGLKRERDDLYQRINWRVEHMVGMGLLEEARRNMPFRHTNALNTVGYKELFRFYDGKLTIYEAIDQIKQHTRNYARRQMTWLRRYPSMQWFHPENIDAVYHHICHSVK